MEKALAHYILIIAYYIHTPHYAKGRIWFLKE